MIINIILDFVIGALFIFYGFRALTKGTLGASTDKKLDDRYTPESVIKYKKFYAVMMFVLGLGFIGLGVLGVLSLMKVIELGSFVVLGISFVILALAILTAVLQYAICKKKES